ncbi:FAD-dependent oxidoreductase [Streptomyces malaysiense]|nr:NAD(P)/FAD-dependent oxidoreductase [Streptomyces malaysiense]
MAQRGLAREDPIRLLIVGAGVAGVAVARLLRARGLHPLVVERAGPGGDGGYMLGLMPFVDPVLREIGVHDRYLESSVGMHRYRLHGASGRVLKEYSLDEAIGRFGHYRGIERGQLLGLLGIEAIPVAYRTTLTGLHQEADRVHVTLAEQGKRLDLEFDAVIAADGLHSATRSLLLDPGQVHSYDTGWGGWVAWTHADTHTDDGCGAYEEIWGAGSFIGLYPVRDRIGVFVGGPHDATAEGPAAFAERVRRTLRTLDGRCARALRAVADTPDAYYWNMSDVRASPWTTGRVALLGDAAAGFLPTAGVGAAMAMESAAVLAEELGATGAASIPRALSTYERTQRPRVETAQNNSRRLARLMFQRGRLITGARDVVTRFVGVNTALGPIRTLLEQRPPSMP